VAAGIFGAAMTDGERFRLLYELAAAFAGQLELEELIPNIIRRCRDTLRAESAAVLLHDAATDELYFPYAAASDESSTERLLETRLPAAEGIAGAVLASGRSELIADAAADSRFYGRVDEHTGLTTRSILVAPLLSRRGPVGVIEVINPIGRAAFSREDLDLLDALAASMAIAIDNARMFSELREREQSLRSTVGALRRDLARRDQFADIVGTSEGIRETLHLMESAASSPISVLIEGETGTGKELVARGIHRASERAEAAFIAVNCAALPADLLEAELFGHARGAFTGAVAERRGLFEAAHGGSMFLDEVGDLPLSMQVKLLRVLQEGEIMPVGTTRPRKVDVRIIAATNHNLRSAVDAGTFRADLYYRISAFPIAVPPLRARRSDVPLLADRFLTESAERHRKKIAGIDANAFALLTAYDWPGNIRQLRNEIERAVALTPQGGTIRAQSFSREISTPGGSPVARPRVEVGSEAIAAPATSRVDEEMASPSAATEGSNGTTEADLRSARTAFESRFIAEQLRANGGNVSRTAEALGISRVMLQKKMKEYGLR
jgi:transcriptional regulator with GAF, ATPase, and Fis domain